MPERARDQVRLEVTAKGKHVSVHKVRAPYLGVGEWTSMPIAQLRYEGDGLWTLYSVTVRGLDPLFDLAPRQPVDVIINELETDPTCVFWG